jgi:hypothetical protein
MADLGGISPVGLQAQSPDTFGTLNTILGIQGKRQQLQIQAQDLQQKQVATDTQQGVSNFFSGFNPLDYVAPDGTTDMDKVHRSAAYNSASAVSRPAIDEQLQKITAGQIKNKSDMMTLGNQGLATMGSAVGKLAQDEDVQAGNEKGRNKVDQTLSDLETQFPGARNQIDLMRTHVKQLQLDKRPDDLKKSVFQAQLAGQDAQNQLAITKPGGATIVDENGQTQVVNVNPYAAGGAASVGQNVGAPMKTGVAPQLTTAPSGAPGRVVGGSFVPLTQPGGGGNVPSPPANKLQPYKRPADIAPKSEQERYTNTMQQSADHVNGVSAAANDTQNGVAATRFRNDKILGLTASGAATGPGKETWNHIASWFPGESGTAYQKIGHYLAQNSAAIAGKMGVPNTNMGAETAAASAGNVAQNPGAIAEITRVNDALNSGLDLYNKGLARVSSNGADPSKVPAFRQAFGQNFDVNVMRYDDALRRADIDPKGSKAEIDRIKSEVGAEGLKALGAKRKILHSLADTGDMP